MQLAFVVQLIFVRFEQGRGRTGVPKTWLPYLAGHPDNPQAVPEVETLVRMALGLLRAQCADPNIGHGRDIMPGDDSEYQLHNADGGRIEAVDQIKWDTITVHDHQEQRADVVLTWRNPAELLTELAPVRARP